MAGTSEIETYTMPNYLNGRDVIDTLTIFKDTAGRHLVMRCFRPTLMMGPNRGSCCRSIPIIQKYKNDGFTINPDWEALANEFPGL
ncbi:MAG: hypothetical protein CM15mP106_1260 [Candidatus Neomarinimicrobiota bacterium]|nr:MAG: hypothetical protein CM15mP106_1260 [Candidatus Neomarinimicrobiota bacterium]